MKFACAIALAVLVIACRTTTITPSAPILVPQGLDLAEVEAAVLAATSATPAARGWSSERIEPGEIRASYYHRRHRLDVAIHFTEYEVTTRITGSELLRQGDGKIHKNALVWRRRLNGRIEQSLAIVDALARRRGPAVSAGPPAASP